MYFTTDKLNKIYTTIDFFFLCYNAQKRKSIGKKIKLQEIEASKIIHHVLGDKRVPTKSDAELAMLFKKRFTKKELEVLNADILGVEKTVSMEALHVDEKRYDTLLASALKNLKNEAVHRDFFN